jgi:hypothetical protein
LGEGEESGGMSEDSCLGNGYERYGVYPTLRPWTKPQHAKRGKALLEISLGWEGERLSLRGFEVNYRIGHDRELQNFAVSRFLKSVCSEYIRMASL